MGWLDSGGGVDETDFPELGHDNASIDTKELEMSMQQNPDRTWTPAQPLPMLGWKARLEEYLRRRGWRRLPNLLARWDECGL